MRHRVYGKHLGRTKNQRTSLFKNLVRSLILFEKIETTESKAKAVKGLVDKIVNQAKSKDTRHLLQQFLSDKNVVEKLVNDLAPRLESRNSGYASIVRLGRRLGDNALIVKMELLLEEPKKSEAKKAAKVEEKKEEKLKPATTGAEKPKKKTKKEEKK